MHRVTVAPTGHEFEAEDGETVFQAARRNGLDWPTRCLGKAACRLCYVFVDEGATNLSAPGRIERDALRRLALEQSAGSAGRAVRLACQARVLADVTVEKSGVHRAVRGADESSEGPGPATAAEREQAQLSRSGRPTPSVERRC